MALLYFQHKLHTMTLWYKSNAGLCAMPAFSVELQVYVNWRICIPLEGTIQPNPTSSQSSLLHTNLHKKREKELKRMREKVFACCQRCQKIRPDDVLGNSKHGMKSTFSSVLYNCFRIYLGFILLRNSKMTDCFLKSWSLTIPKGRGDVLHHTGPHGNAPALGSVRRQEWEESFRQSLCCGFQGKVWVMRVSKFEQDWIIRIG